MALNAYIDRVQLLLHDLAATYYNVTDLTTYINIARGQIAAEGQCVRLLLPSAAPISSITLTSGGSGYTSPPTVNIIAGASGGQVPIVQATAHTTLFSGSVNQIIIDNPGNGYDKTATVTLTGGGGTGATGVPVVNVWNTVIGQEVYTFAAANAIAQLTPGIQGIIGLISVSVSWGALKPTLKKSPWTDFQAYLRANNTGLMSWPVVWAQYGQGANGSIYVYPWPSQVNQWDWDVYAYPINLASDADPEVIPWPWTDCIPYYAAWLAYDNSQRKGDSDRMLQIYERFMKRARAMSEPDFVPDPYDGVDWSY